MSPRARRACAWLSAAAVGWGCLNPQPDTTPQASPDVAPQPVVDVSPPVVGSSPNVPGGNDFGEAPVRPGAQVPADPGSDAGVEPEADGGTPATISVTRAGDAGPPPDAGSPDSDGG
jgi:hypothetical protein